VPVPHVVHVVTSLACGGLERLVVDWTNERNRRMPGSTSVCCFDEPGELASQVDGRVACVGLNRARKPLDWAGLSRLRRLLKLAQVVHTHNLAALQHATLAGWGLPLGRVHTEHGTNPHVRGWKNRLRNRWLARAAGRVVAVSEYTAVEIARAWRLPAGRLSVIPNGVTEAPSVSAEEEARLAAGLGLDPSMPVLGSVGRLADVKGYDRLIRAFAEVVRRSEVGGLRPEVGEKDGLKTETRHLKPYLLLIGDGPDRVNLESLAARLGVSGQVCFAGFRSDARRLLPLMDLFVLPSRSEGLSVSLLEAMSAGVPVCVTDVGENRAVLAGGECGTLLPDDEAGWSATLAGLLTEEGGAAARRRAEAARARVADHYSLAATVDAYERLYSDTAIATGKRN
jgi:glycosyltransferase involved in cell wall biosynthesis